MIIAENETPRGVSESVKQLVLTGAAAAFWKWYYAHADSVLIRRKLVFFSVTVHVRDIQPLFLQIFGPPSSAGILA